MKNLYNAEYGHEFLDVHACREMHQKMYLLHRTIAQGSYLVPGVSFDLRELKFGVIWIHTLDFFTSWCSKNLKRTF